MTKGSGPVSRGIRSADRMVRRVRSYCLRRAIEANERLVFERRLAAFLRGREPTLVVDVGANLGQSIRLYRRLNPSCRVISFEPNPSLFAQLERKYGADDKIALIQKGVSDHNGTAQFHESHWHLTSSIEETEQDSPELGKTAAMLGLEPADMISCTYEIQVLRLFDFLTEAGLESVDMLKIDVEGHEYACLQGLFVEPNQIAERIQLEAHGYRMYRDEKGEEQCAGLLAEHGYREEQRIAHGFGNFEDVIYVRTRTDSAA